MELSDILATFVVFSVPIIGLTGLFVTRIVGLIARQRAAERFYRERMATWRGQAKAASSEG